MTQSAKNMLVHRARFMELNGANITALAFSHVSKLDKRTPSDLRLALGRSNGDLEIWNPRNGWCQELVIQGGKDRTIEGLVWSNVPGESLRLFSIGGSTVVTEWDLKTGLALKNYDCNAGVIWSLALSSSQTKLAVGCDNGCVVVIDISGGSGVMEHEAVLQRQDSRVLSVSWKEDEFVIGGCADGRIRVWSASKNDEMRSRIIQTMKVDKSKKESTLVWSIIYLPKLNQIVSGDSTGSVKVWDLQYATLTQTFKTHEADVLCLTTDETNTKVFSAGVDRKIYQYTLSPVTSPKKSFKWAVASNRLLHSNDVRTMTSYQSKGADFLVSGGVEKNLIISSVSTFSDGNYTKISYAMPFHKNVLINKEQRLCIMWQHSTVKIWTIGGETNSDTNYRLVCKLSLKDEQNITTCALSPDGQVLVVARPNATKLFHLQPTNGKLKVTKLDNDFLLKTGTKHVRFSDNSHVIIVSAKNEVLLFDLEDDDADEKPTEIQLPELTENKSAAKLPHTTSINHLDVSGSFVVITRLCGAVDLINLIDNSVIPIARLMNLITAIHISKRDTVVLTTADNKILEFSIKETEEASIGTMSDWCKKNKDVLPKDFEHMKGKCLGIFSGSAADDRMWFWGFNYLATFDMSQDLPVNTRKRPKKHRIDGNTVTDGNNFIDAGEEDDDDDEEELADAQSFMRDRLTSDDTTNRTSKDGKAFFITEKYKSILMAEDLSDHEIIVVENPFASKTFSLAAFDLPKIIL
ncbi:LANO_0B05666g1_1 [Lachancea nothofagi CBS 11611]|uniref:LANO_0B05666g1_1 n=1 Tax=Lachancea nothofagi CBS 11611 TaxID=1266666 RepID=A0A1G4IYQ3_9SACH|nr:LANO_0B05666g1_1 [Lachancea nothofagi CBS 11611]